MNKYTLVITLLLCTVYSMTVYAHTSKHNNSTVYIHSNKQNSKYEPSNHNTKRFLTPSKPNTVLKQQIHTTIVPSKIRNYEQTFGNAKKILRELYAKEYHGKYKEADKTFYCGCPIVYSGRKMIGPDLKNCGYKIRKQANRAVRIEWEHVVPAYNLGNQRQCWQKGGRKNCVKNDPLFSFMEGDMHNLFPSVGEVNEARANYRFIEGKQTSGQFGQCPIYVDYRARSVIPPNSVRGTIARAYLYMYSRYKLNMSQREYKMFESWNRQYPPSEWECYRNQRIKAIQGNDNQFITRGCIRSAK